MPLRLDVAAQTDPGLMRGDNQDSFLVIPPAPAEPWAVLAVCDGMGGAAGGDVASKTAVEVLREVMTAGGAPETRDALGRRLLHGVEEASRRVFATACRRRELKGMGTTATACALAGDMLYLAQVGDSRAYLYRDGQLTKVTRDQTLATLMMEQGQLAPEDLETFPYPNVILQAVGTHERVDVDLTRVRVARGDVILVCSDGLYGYVPHDAVRDAIEREPAPTAACQALVRLAIEAGGPDNVTCIVARVGGSALEPPEGPPAPEKARLDEDQTLSRVEPAARPLQEEPAGDADAVGMSLIARLAAVFRRRRSS